MIVLDTSVWVGYLLATDVHHADSVVWFDNWSIRDNVVHMPTLCLVELGGALRRQQVELGTIELLLAEITHRNVHRWHELDVQSAELAASIASTGFLKGADAVFVAWAAWLGLPLVTWDHQQRERGARFCRTMTPVDAREMI